jgi:hypothetical protein
MALLPCCPDWLGLLPELAWLAGGWGLREHSSHKAVFCEQIVRTTRYNWQNSASEIETNTNQYWAIS